MIKTVLKLKFFLEISAGVNSLSKLDFAFSGGKLLSQIRHYKWPHGVTR